MKLKKSSLLAKLIILILAVYATVTLLTLQSRIQTAQEETASLQAQIESITQANNRLEADIETAGTAEGLEAIARERLGFVYDGEIIFHDIGD